MAATNSKIEWTNATWNPIRGCSCISPGCANCYAMRMGARFSEEGRPFFGYAIMSNHGPKWTGKVALIENQLQIPLRWKRPKTIFVNSMSDMFHEDLPESDIQRVFHVMKVANWHQYQILTTRSERLAEVSPRLDWKEHVWMGVSIENAKYAYRLDHLRASGAKVKFLSLEPLLGPLPKLDLSGVDWVIAGGESGPGARPMNIDWVREIRDWTKEQGVAFFFKQFGKKDNNPNSSDPTIGETKGGRMLDGQLWDEMPAGTELSRVA